MKKTQIINHIKYFPLKQLAHKSFKKYERYLNGNVLDIGAGLSPYHTYLTNAKITSLDNNKKLKPDIVGSIYAIPREEGTFNSIICTEVLEHIAEPSKAIKECYRVLKRNGYIYITTPFMWGLHYEPHDYYRYTKHGLEYLLTTNGFTVINIQPLGGFSSFVGARICRNIYNLFDRLSLPKKITVSLATVLALPIGIMFYLISKITDKDSKLPVTYAVLARKR